MTSSTCLAGKLNRHGRLIESGKLTLEDIRTLRIVFESFPGERRANE
jgi:hypothetical protein